jgi:hypothetical protein
MRAVVIGRLADPVGHCRHTDLEQRNGRLELARTYSIRSSTEYRSQQPERIALDYEHGRTVGTVTYLTRSSAGLFAVAVVDHIEELPTVEGLYFSPESTATIHGIHGTDITLDRVALTERPATIAAPKVRIVPGELDSILRNRPHLLGSDVALAKAAAAHCGGTSTIVDHGASSSPMGEDEREQWSPRSRSRPPSGMIRMIDGRPTEILFSTPYRGVLSVH